MENDLRHPCLGGRRNRERLIALKEGIIRTPDNQEKKPAYSMPTNATTKSRISEQLYETGKRPADEF